MAIVYRGKAFEHFWMEFRTISKFYNNLQFHRFDAVNISKNFEKSHNCEKSQEENKRKWQIIIIRKFQKVKITKLTV